MKKIFVRPISKPLRLDKYLTNEIKNISREKIIFLIKNGKIKVIGKEKTKPSLLLKGGEEICLDVSALEKKPDLSILQPQVLYPEPKILYEDDNLLIIDKPAGIIVHPTFNNIDSPTIAGWILQKYPFLSRVGDPSTGSGQGNLRPGIVHRLDKETSGVLIIAKNNSAFNYLKNLFQQRKIKKKYIALVRGEIKTLEGEIDLPLGRSKKSPIRRKVVINSQTKKAKTALTKYRVLKRFQGYTLLEIIPETGRTHQIRVHLASIGFPVVGDKIYGKAKKPEDLILQRHFLHAKEVSFISPSGKLILINAPLPQELEKILAQLKPIPF